MTSTAPSTTRTHAASPRLAALLGWVLPGAGHLYAGHPARAVLVFTVVVLPFVAGWLVVGERLFGFSGPMGRGGLLAVLPYYVLPEFGNLGAITLAGLLLEPGTSDFQRLMRLPRPGEHIGLTLTACSGVLNVLFAAEAHWLARRGPAPRPHGNSPPMAALLSWLVPGLAHWRLGQRGKGVLVGCAIVLLFVLGLVFSGFTAVDRPQFFWWWAGMIFFGGGTIPASILLGPLPITQTLDFMDLGITLCTVAGLMNVVVMVDAYSLAEKAYQEPAGGAPGAQKAPS